MRHAGKEVVYAGARVAGTIAEDKCIKMYDTHLVITKRGINRKNDMRLSSIHKPH